MFQRIMLSSRVLAACLACLVLGLAGCAAAATTIATGGTPTVAAGATPTATAGSGSPCLQLIPTGTLANGVPGVPGIQLPTGTYISPAATQGGGTGQYTVTSYELCFQGQESAIDSTNGSTISNLVAGGWQLNNLFPDPTSIAYLDPCSPSQTATCVNTSGTPNPFTFLSVDFFTIPSPGYSAFRLQVATIAAPTCLNDPNYYAGTPQYSFYFNAPYKDSSGNPVYRFQLPPGTRDSTFLGGGTAGSDYVYYCSNGTVATVNAFLQHSWQSAGFTVSGPDSSGCLEAMFGTHPTYSFQTCTTNTNNYYLRVFVPQ